MTSSSPSRRANVRNSRHNQENTCKVGTHSNFNVQERGYNKQPVVKQQSRLNPAAAPFKPVQASLIGGIQKPASPSTSQLSSKAPAFIPAPKPAKQSLPFGGKGAKIWPNFPQLAGFNIGMVQPPLEIGVVQPQTRKRENTEDTPASKKAHIDASPSKALNPRTTVFKPLVQPSLSSSGNRRNKRRPIASDFFDLAPGSQSMWKSNKEAALEFEIKMKAVIMEYEANKAKEEARIEQERLEKQRLEEEKLANEEKAKQEAVLKAEAEKKAQEEAVLKAQIEFKKAMEAERVAKEQQAQQAQQEGLAKMKAAHVAAVQRIRKEREEKAKRQQARQEKLRLQKEAYQRKMEAKIQEQKETIGGLFDNHCINRGMYDELMEEANPDIGSQRVQNHMEKQARAKTYIKERIKPWLSRSRHTIGKRNASISKRSETLRWSKDIHNNNPYSRLKIENLYKTRKQRTPEMMAERASWALDSDETAKEFNIYKVNNPK
jgi:hypothetical protein